MIDFGTGSQGTPLDWWSWGKFDAHEDIVVAAGEINVTHPPDDDGRSEVVVLASDWIEFRSIE